MPIKGVTSQEEVIIKEILAPYAEYQFYYYGSRARGNFRELSDLDILIKSEGIVRLSDIEDLKESFDLSNLPYVVNLSYNVDENFYKLIEKDLVKCF